MIKKIGTSEPMGKFSNSSNSVDISFPKLVVSENFIISKSSGSIEKDVKFLTLSLAKLFKRSSWAYYKRISTFKFEIKIFQLIICRCKAKTWNSLS